MHAFLYSRAIFDRRAIRRLQKDASLAFRLRLWSRRPCASIWVGTDDGAWLLDGSSGEVLKRRIHGSEPYISGLAVVGVPRAALANHDRVALPRDRSDRPHWIHLAGSVSVRSVRSFA